MACNVAAEEKVDERLDAATSAREREGWWTGGGWFEPMFMKMNQIKTDAAAAGKDKQRAARDTLAK